MPTIVPATGAYTSVPGGAPTSRAEVPVPWLPESRYQCGQPDPPPKTRVRDALQEALVGLASRAVRG